MGFRKLRLTVLFLQLLLLLHLLNSALGVPIFRTNSIAKLEASNLETSDVHKEVMMPEKGAAGMISVTKEMAVVSKRGRRGGGGGGRRGRAGRGRGRCGARGPIIFPFIHGGHHGSNKGSSPSVCPNFMLLSALAFLVFFNISHSLIN